MKRLHILLVKEKDTNKKMIINFKSVRYIIEVDGSSKIVLVSGETFFIEGTPENVWEAVTLKN